MYAPASLQRRYKYVPGVEGTKGARGYALLAEEKVLDVMAMIRLGGIQFDSVPRRDLRPKAPGPAVGYGPVRNTQAAAVRPSPMEAEGGRGRGGRGVGGHTMRSGDLFACSGDQCGSEHRMNP